MTQPPQGPVPPGPELPSQTPSYPAAPRYPVPPHLEHATSRPDPRHLPPASRTMAGWALGLAIVPCFGIGPFVAIGLAIAVLVQSRDGRDHGKGLAIAALAIAPLWIIGFVVAAVVGAVGDLTTDADRDSQGQVVGRDEMSTLKIRAGDCFDYPELLEEQASGTVTAVPCVAPHQFEAYFEFFLPDGDYPGDDRVSLISARRCLREFHAFVGVPYGQSTLEPYNLYPSSMTWRVFDDRKVTCAVTDPDSTSTTGSLRNLRR
jgi:hypothetical protein